MTRYRKWLLLGCAGILVIFMLTIMARVLTRQIAVKRLHMDNAFTRMILVGEKELQKIPEPMNNIDWEALYPFEEQEDVEYSIKSSGTETLLSERVKWKITSIEKKVDKWTNQYLVGYQSMVEMAEAYDVLLHWNLTKRMYGTIEICDDGYLINHMDYADVGEDIFAVTDLYAYCQKNGIPLLYVQAPYKVSPEEEISGRLDFSNQKMDELLKELRENHVPCLDLRENIKAENLPHRNLFYRTDHHWKSQTGLWAAGQIARRLNADFGFAMDIKLLDEDAFDTVVYHDRFLGSEGRRVTLARAKPEDITLFYPKYPTSVRFMIPDKKLDITGDFSVIYDMQELKKDDFYEADAYCVFSPGGSSLTIQQNNDQPNGKRILFLNDSYARCVAPFLALCAGEVASIDERFFTGSIKGYIAQTKPDLVILLYYPGNLKKIDWSHKVHFDFR